MTQTRTSPSGPEVELPEPPPAGYAPSQARYVDYRDTGSSSLPLIPPEDQNGSAMFPFDSLQKAADSIEQTAEPTLIILYPGDTNDQAKKDVDLTAFVDVQIKGLNVTGSLGFSQVGNILATGANNIALEDLEIESLDANPAQSIVYLRDGGRYLNVTCQFLSFSGQSKANTLGVFAMQIIDATVSDQMVGAGAEISRGVAGVARLSGCITTGGALEVTIGGTPSHFTNCDSITIDAPVGGLLYIDSWTASNLPGFTVINGAVPTVI